jgi:hypothetical protein
MDAKDEHRQNAKVNELLSQGRTKATANFTSIISKKLIRTSTHGVT